MTNREKLLNVIKENFPEIDHPEALVQGMVHTDCFAIECPVNEECKTCPNKNFWNKEYQNKTKEGKNND